MRWLAVIIIRFLAGAVAKFFMPGPQGFIVTALVGVAGAVLATWLGRYLGWYAPWERAHFIGAIIGAVVILAIYRALSGGPRA